MYFQQGKQEEVTRTMRKLVDREGRYPKLADQGELATALVKALSSANACALINGLYHDLTPAGDHQPATRDSNPPLRKLHHQRRLETDERRQLVEGFKAGATFAELASRFRIHRTTVRAQLDRAGLEFLPNGAKLTRADIEIASGLYLDGESLASIGERFNVDAETIRSALRRAGVAIRPRNGWK